MLTEAWWRTAGGAIAPTGRSIERSWRWTEARWKTAGP